VCLLGVAARAEAGVHDAAMDVTGAGGGADGTLRGGTQPGDADIVERIVAKIDEIVRLVRFPGWQTTSEGEREMRKALRRTLVDFKLHQDAELSTWSANCAESGQGICYPHPVQQVSSSWSALVWQGGRRDKTRPKSK
jgi:hypothetical protein